MFQLSILLIGYSIILFMCLTSSRIILTPQLCFTVSFIPQTLYAYFWIDRWNINLDYRTVIVLLGGNLLFYFSIMVSSKFGFSSIKLCRDVSIKYRDNTKRESYKYETSIDNWKLVLFLAVSICVVIFSAYRMKNISGAATFGDSFQFFRLNSDYETDEGRLPFFIRNLRTFIEASSYFWSYLLIRNIVYKADKKNRMLLTMICAVCILNMLTYGSRGRLLNLITATAFQIYFVTNQKKGWVVRKQISRKAIFRTIVVVMLIIILFQWSLPLFGRSIGTRTFSYYLAVYLAAEIKNLDTFIRSGTMGGKSLATYETCRSIINFFAKHFGQPDLIHDTAFTFNRIGGSTIGNVYTVYSPFLYDFGYLGMLIFIPIMATICWIVFKKAVTFRRREVSVAQIACSYIYFTILFSFFSCKFYENIFTIGFILKILYWYVLKLFIERVSL